MNKVPELDELPMLLDNLTASTQPNWGVMNAAQMCRHCSSFIRVSMGEKKTSRITRLMGLLVGKYMYRYFSSKNPYNFPKNIRTLPEIKQRTDRVLDFELEKEELTTSLHKAIGIQGKIQHPLYGKMDAASIKGLIGLHTAYHFRQFGLFE